MQSKMQTVHVHLTFSCFSFQEANKLFRRLKHISLLAKNKKTASSSSLDIQWVAEYPISKSVRRISMSASYTSTELGDTQCNKSHCAYINIKVKTSCTVRQKDQSQEPVNKWEEYTQNHGNQKVKETQKHCWREEAMWGRMTEESSYGEVEHGDRRKWVSDVEQEKPTVLRIMCTYSFNVVLRLLQVPPSSYTTCCRMQTPCVPVPAS